MGREIRRVPPNWDHPKNGQGEYLPVHDRDYNEASESWIRKFLSFENCKKEGNITPLNVEYYWESESPPDPDFYISCYRSYEIEKANWYQIFETESIGTPVTPAFSTQEELIDHLINYGESLNPFNSGGIKTEWAKRFVLEIKKTPRFKFYDHDNT